ncbi:MAG: Glu/Leu/Phe/Val dehydrogenase [Planctomycetia bacterium]|nr:Glu/Leu/Phe/Val dehydrogenase [Planctomycetia bacterium]
MKITDIAVPGYERVARCEDPASGLRAMIAVHSTALGPALGGLRMWPYRSWDEAQFDVLRLARGMTYKSAVADTGLGGGKSVILGNPKTDKSEALFRAMGKFVDAFGGKYITAEDVGTSVEDLVLVRKETRWATGLPREIGSSGDPSPWTALGVFRGIKACLEEVYGSGEFTGRTVAMQGLGHVGGFLAEHLAKAGARLVVTDLSPERAKEAATRLGATVVAPEAIYDVACDVFSPNALGAVINDDTLKRLKTKIIAGAANNVLLREEHGDRLREMGILYAPDYVINAGGIINVSIEVEKEGYDEARSRKKVENIYNALRTVFRMAREKNVSTNRASNLLAEERIARGRPAAAKV